MLVFQVVYYFFILRNYAFANPKTIEFKTEQSSLTECMDTSTACTIFGDESCSIDSLKPNSEFNLIRPGGYTSCMNINYPFVFSVELGGSTKDVLLYFQAGGFCYDQHQYDNFICNVCPVKGTRGGIIDARKSENVFKKYTIIEVIYL